MIGLKSSLSRVKGEIKYCIENVMCTEVLKSIFKVLYFVIISYSINLTVNIFLLEQISVEFKLNCI